MKNPHQLYETPHLNQDRLEPAVRKSLCKYDTRDNCCRDNRSRKQLSIERKISSDESNCSRYYSNHLENYNKKKKKEVKMELELSSLLIQSKGILKCKPYLKISKLGLGEN